MLEDPDNAALDALVVQGGPLDAKEKYSFDHPPIVSKEDWEGLLEKTWTDAENLAAATEQML